MITPSAPPDITYLSSAENYTEFTEPECPNPSEIN